MRNEARIQRIQWAHIHADIGSFASFADGSLFGYPSQDSKSLLLSILGRFMRDSGGYCLSARSSRSKTPTVSVLIWPRQNLKLKRRSTSQSSTRCSEMSSMDLSERSLPFCLAALWAYLQASDGSTVGFLVVTLRLELPFKLVYRRCQWYCSSLVHPCTPSPLARHERPHRNPQQQQDLVASPGIRVAMLQAPKAHSVQFSGRFKAGTPKAR